MADMQVTPDELMRTIGQQHVENVRLRQIAAVLAQKVDELQKKLDKATKKKDKKVKK